MYMLGKGLRYELMGAVFDKVVIIFTVVKWKEVGQKHAELLLYFFDNIGDVRPSKVQT